jgi:4,5-dihydroxyphthalate decarboxylase
MQHQYGGSLKISTGPLAIGFPKPRPGDSIESTGKIKIDFLPSDQTLEGMLEAGQLEALFALYIPSIFQKGSPRIARLFPNYYEIEQDYYRRTKIFPIMHTVVVGENVYREHPWVTGSIYKAFCEAGI